MFTKFYLNKCRRYNRTNKGKCHKWAKEHDPVDRKMQTSIVDWRNNWDKLFDIVTKKCGNYYKNNLIVMVFFINYAFEFWKFTIKL
jgi:hypothetical protein